MFDSILFLQNVYTGSVTKLMTLIETRPPFKVDVWSQAWRRPLKQMEEESNVTLTDDGAFSLIMDLG